MPDLNEIYHFLPINETLLTSGQPTQEQFGWLPALGVKTIINLALPTSSNALADEAGLVISLGMEYIHIPVIWENPTKENLDKFFTAMENQGSQKILVHCAANMRVSAFIALYRILRLGWEREKAFREVYPIWDPLKDPVWGKFIETVLGQ